MDYMDHFLYDNLAKDYPSDAKYCLLNVSLCDISNSHREVRNRCLFICFKDSVIIYIQFHVSFILILLVIYFRYMAICHPFLVQRSRKPSTFHTVVHQTTEPNLYNKDSIDCHGRISDTAEKCNWLKKMGGCFKSSRGGSNNSGMTLKKRTCHYLFPVLIFSILLNIPKFLEFETFIIR